MKTINVNKTWYSGVLIGVLPGAPSWANDLNRDELGVRYESQAVMQRNW